MEWELLSAYRLSCQTIACELKLYRAEVISYLRGSWLLVTSFRFFFPWEVFKNLLFHSICFPHWFPLKVALAPFWSDNKKYLFIISEVTLNYLPWINIPHFMQLSVFLKFSGHYWIIENTPSRHLFKK